MEAGRAIELRCLLLGAVRHDLADACCGSERAKTSATISFCKAVGSEIVWRAAVARGHGQGGDKEETRTMSV